ncbi:MAG: hypothetical protein QQN41_13995, partial [Nitrosopumilus sp.]
EKVINLWLRSGSPNRNLTILTALQLERNWDGTIRLIRIVKDQSEVNRAKVGLRQIVHRGRLPIDAERLILVGEFNDQLKKCPQADLNIFGMPKAFNPDLMTQITKGCDTACLFIKDSGEESALV